jgi:hypothetical protein
MQPQTDIMLPNYPGYQYGILLQGMWRGTESQPPFSQGWIRYVPLDSSGNPNFTCDSGGTCPWQGTLNLSSYPGSGVLQSQTDIMLPNYPGYQYGVLLQGFWRGHEGGGNGVSNIYGTSEGYIRYVPLNASGNPDFTCGSNGTCPWQGTLNLSSAPGSGVMQPQTDIMLPNYPGYQYGVLLQGMWRGRDIWTGP